MAKLNRDDHKANDIMAKVAKVVACLTGAIAVFFVSRKNNNRDSEEDTNQEEKTDYSE